MRPNTLLHSQKAMRSPVTLLTSYCLLLLPFYLTTETRAELIGVAWHDTDGPVYAVDEDTGDVTLIGQSGIGRLNSLARDSQGTFYSITDNSSGDDYLVSINSNTGAGNVLATLSGIQDPSIRGLAFANNGTLYGIQDGGGVGGTFLDDKLVTIDTSTGLVSVVGDTVGTAVLQALGADANGTLYSWSGQHDADLGLVTIDQATGAVTDVAANDTGYGILQSIAITEEGSAFGWLTGLQKVDLSTGQLTQIGGNVADIRGLESTAVPEPSTLVAALLACGAALVLIRRRRTG